MLTSKTTMFLALISPEPFGGISMETFKFARQKEELCKKTHAPCGMRQSKLLLGDFILKRARFCADHSRNQLGLLTGFQTGHYKLRKYLMWIGIVNESHCQ